LGRIVLADRAVRLIPDAIEQYALHALHVSVEHALSAGMLPLHHKDPFDRMLIAQARAEGLRVVTANRIFAAYAVEVIEAGS
jgi:PIN domain nuclease of toxin-antitoxin system